MTDSPLRPWRSAGLLLAGLGLLSVFAIEPSESVKRRAAAEQVLVEGQVEGPGGGSTVTAPGTAAGGGKVSGPSGGSATGGKPGTSGGSVAGPAKPGAGAPASKYECRAGANGGATSRGVSGNRIKLAATNVRSGPGSSFLGSSFVGMQAVVNRVNAKGGICGRLLELKLVDDGWDAQRGSSFLQNFTRQDYFALPVVPSSEGLTQAITNGTISRAGIPVIGSDGMLKEQYSNPWVWPVATSTVSTIRVMTKHAKDKGAQSFGIVYDKRYRFGLEGAAAFKAYVKSLTGKDPDAFIGITPERANYSGDAQAFNEACPSGGCDFVAMLLDPTTANTYIASQSDKDGRRQGFGRILTGGAQPLFNERFARDCGGPCDGMLVWTGYNPPIGRLASVPDVSQYVSDVRSVDPGADVTNQFLEGAYLGMKVFVRALEQVGPELTRERLQAVMNSMTFKSSLSSTLSWTPEQRFANQTAQAFRVVTASGTFAGFAETDTGFRRDPTPGVVPKG